MPFNTYRNKARRRISDRRVPINPRFPKVNARTMPYRYYRTSLFLYAKLNARSSVNLHRLGLDRSQGLFALKPNHLLWQDLRHAQYPPGGVCGLGADTDPIPGTINVQVDFLVEGFRVAVGVRLGDGVVGANDLNGFRISCRSTGSEANYVSWVSAIRASRAS
jgi:hypothetical protein